MNWSENMDSRWKTIQKKIASLTPGHWMTLLLTGILLAVLSLPGTDTRSEKKRNGTDLVRTIEYQGISSEFLLEEQTTEECQEIKNILEKRLENFLASVQGVGNVKTLIMTTENRTDYYTSSIQTVTGILVVAQGADNPVTVQNIKDALVALFQLEPHKIKIMKMK